MMEFISVNLKEKSKYVVREKKDCVFFLQNNSGCLEIDIRRPGARVFVFALFLGRGQEKFSLETLQRHSAPDTFSELLVKSVLFDRSQFSFRGLVRIEKGAGKSHAYQKNQNLLMSDKALVESRPELEILADDVFCTHAVTTSRLNPEQVFFLRQRGLKTKTAEKLLLQGFFHEVFEKVNSLHEQV